MLLKILTSESLNNEEPLPDMAICSICGWKGKVSDCETDEEGDWESGYYVVHLCPVCEDGGCIDDYFMSRKKSVEWRNWFVKHHNNL